MSTSEQIEALAAQLDSDFRKSMDAQGRALFRQLILLLAAGRPITVEHLASALDRPYDELLHALRQMPSLEWDADDHIVGAGLTLHPTPHQVRLNGRTVFAWCALDTLMFPPLLRQTASVESPCVTTGMPVRVTVTPSGVEQVEPPTAVVSLVALGVSPDIRRAFCDYVNFFSSPEAASAWLAAHTGATTLPVAEAYQLGRILARTIWR